MAKPSSFEVGDAVRVATDAYFYGPPVGAVGLVKRTTPDNDFLIVAFLTGGSFAYTPDEVDLIRLNKGD